MECDTGVLHVCNVVEDSLRCDDGVDRCCEDGVFRVWDGDDVGVGLSVLNFFTLGSLVT
jgi:hypothetical protein